MARLLAWWQRMLGRRPAAPPQPSPATPEGRHPADRAPPGDLSLTNDGSAKGTSRIREAGFDPYSSDGGYAKPHSWERVDRD